MAGFCVALLAVSRVCAVAFLCCAQGQGTMRGLDRSLSCLFELVQLIRDQFQDLSQSRSKQLLKVTESD